MAILDFLRSDGYITVNKKLIRAVGLDAAVFYSELISKYFYFKENGKLDVSEEFFVTVEDMEEATCLSRKTQPKAIQVLVKLNLIQFRVKGVPPKRYFKVNEDEEVLIKLLEMAKTRNTSQRGLLKSPIGDNKYVPTGIIDKPHWGQSKSPNGATNNNNITINNTKEQQTPPRAVVVVSEHEPVHKLKTKTALDVSCLSFIVELSDMDKLNILKRTDNDIMNIQVAYDIAKQQGGIDSLTAWIITMVKKLQAGEVSQPVKVNAPVKQNRFVNFEQRKIDFAELERLEREQLKAGMKKDDEQEEQEEFVNCFADVR